MANLVEFDRELYPVVVQDRTSGRVLMSAFADQEALDRTRATGLAHFYSRSRRTLWQKGETSGHILPVVEVVADCDQDSYLYLADPIHPVCHRNTPGCFDRAPDRFGMVETVHGWIAERRAGPPDPESYAQRQLGAPIDRLLKKIGEEASEVIIAALAEEGRRDREVIWESADLLFHLALVWERLGISPADVTRELVRRHRPEPPNT